MTTAALRPQVPILDEGRALATASELADALRADAAERDRERRLPHDEVAALKASGLLALSIPLEYGGPGLRASTIAEVFRRIATADPNLAQIPHSHFVYLNFARECAQPAQQSALFGQVLGGALVANAQAERGGATARAISTALVAGDDGRLLLNGAKYYCTGTLFADVIAVLATLDDRTGDGPLAPGEHVVFVPAGSDGLALVDDWDGLGQRITGSGSVLLDAVDVLPEWVVPRLVLDRPNGYGALAQLLHAAIDVGIARAALDDAAAFVRTTSRPWAEAGVGRAVDDPLTAQRFGELSVELVAAEAVLERAGRAVDAVLAEPGEERATRASLDVATAKVLGERAAVGIGSALFEVAGTRAAAAGEGLDRHWRNARTHTLHDPVRWKYQHLGRYVLTGQAPPRSASF